MRSVVQNYCYQPLHMLVRRRRHIALLAVASAFVVLSMVSFDFTKDLDIGTSADQPAVVHSAALYKTTFHCVCPLAQLSPPVKSCQPVWRHARLQARGKSVSEGVTVTVYAHSTSDFQSVANAFWACVRNGTSAQTSWPWQKAAVELARAPPVALRWNYRALLWAHYTEADDSSTVDVDLSFPPLGFAEWTFANDIVQRFKITRVLLAAVDTRRLITDILCAVLSTLTDTTLDDAESTDVVPEFSTLGSIRAPSHATDMIAPSDSSTVPQHLCARIIAYTQTVLQSLTKSLKLRSELSYGSEVVAFGSPTWSGAAVMSTVTSEIQSLFPSVVVSAVNFERLKFRDRLLEVSGHRVVVTKDVGALDLLWAAPSRSTWIVVLDEILAASSPALQRAATLSTVLSNLRLIVVVYDERSSTFAEGAAIRAAIARPWSVGVHVVQGERFGSLSPRLKIRTMQYESMTWKDASPPVPVVVNGREYAPSRIACICSPSGLSDAGCNVLLENTPVDVDPGKSLTFHIAADSTHRFRSVLSGVRRCIGGPDVDAARTIYWPSYATGGGPGMKVRFVRASLEPMLACQQRGWNETVQWHVSRVYSYTPYHFLFDRGVLQVNMFKNELLKFANELGIEMPPITLNLVNEVDPRVPNPYARQPVHEMLDAIVGSNAWHVFDSGLQCGRLTTFAYGFKTPMRFSKEYELEPPLIAELKDLSERLIHHLGAKYGDPAEASAGQRAPLNPRSILLNDVMIQPHDNQGRARGVKPPLLQELVDGLNARTTADDKTDIHRLAFLDSVSMKDQFHAIRSHRVFISGEGAFFVMMLLAAPKSTFVMVYDHVRDPAEWKHSTFHASIASALPNVRLIIFVIDNGSVPPTTRLVEAIASPWAAGVVFLGADRFGNRDAAAS